MFSLKILFSLLLDLLFGDPRCYPHPVRCIGWLIDQTEKITRKVWGNEYVAGGITVFTVLFLVWGVLHLLFSAVSVFPPWCTDAIAIFVVYTCIAVKDLKKESMAVYEALVQRESLVRVRSCVARIVGRDTAELDREGVLRATVETVAENMADGIIAPLFWVVVASIIGNFFGGNAIIYAAMGGLLYKAVNTMDSMIGYKNATYLKFGRVAARLDDCLNWLPARLTGLGIVAAAYILGLNSTGAWQIFKRDRLSHSSPNAGHPESAVAGALGLSLCGPAMYFGEQVDKPYIGDNLRQIEPFDIVRVNHLALVTTLVLLIVMLGVRAMLMNF